MTSSLWHFFFYYCHNFWLDIDDPRMSQYSLLRGGPWKIVLLVIIYILLVTHWLPEYMKNKKPLRMNNLILVHNLFHLSINLFGVYWSAISLNYGSILLDFRYPSRDDWSEDTLWYLHLGWVYLVSRLMEFLDTVFFVLRHNTNKLTLAHVYHHATVPLMTWFTFKHDGMIPMIRLYLLLNCSLHSLQFAYLFFGQLYPPIRQRQWLKTFVMQFEIYHLVVVAIYCLLVFFMQQGDYPLLFLCVIMAQIPTFALLYSISKSRKSSNVITEDIKKKK